MGSIAAVIVILVIAYFVVRAVQTTSKASARPSVRVLSRSTDEDDSGNFLDALDGSNASLSARWKTAEAERDSGATSTYPHWFFDPPTERQMERIARMGLRMPADRLNKGAASDLIGLSEPLDDQHQEILAFFKQPKKGMNQTLGRYAVKDLLADTKNYEAWHQRPAEPLQREFFKFFAIPMPKGLTRADAKKRIADHRNELAESDAHRLVAWDSLESIAEQLADPETREEFEIKKPSLPAIRSAVDALLAEGNSMEDLETSIDIVAEKLIEMRPSLARQST